MEDYIQCIFDRADLQVIRALLIGGTGDVGDIDKRTYKQRISEENAPFYDHLERTYPDGAARDAVFADFSRAITAHQDVYFELGMKCGARLLYQLLFERDPEASDT